jgi:hypothetical protein
MPFVAIKMGRREHSFPATHHRELQALAGDRAAVSVWEWRIAEFSEGGLRDFRAVRSKEKGAIRIL